jgi:long-chain acyl-CoA synthetase
MNFSAWNSLTEMFFEQAGKLENRNFLWTKRDGAYRPLTWRDTAAAVKDLSRGLRSIGIERGDRIVLVSENRPEWLIADLAIMAAGAITVPSYTTGTVHDHLHVLSNSGAKGVIVSTRALARKLLPAVLDSGSCKWVISIEDLEQGQSVPIDLYRWDKVLEQGRAMPDDVREFIGFARRGDTACFIYTSGTGGVPKAVMLSHGSILCNCMGAYHLLEELGLEREVFLCFLPLTHSYEHTAGQFFPMSIGAEIYYAEGVEHLLTNLAEAKPTIMTAVPRLYETMLQKMRRGVAAQSPFKQRLFELAVTLGRKRYLDPASLSAKEKLLDWIVELLVRRKVKKRFGGRLKAMVSGGAALNPEIGIFFVALGLPVLQGYGQTESAPVISANRPSRVKMHTVGPALRGVELRIADDGEILVRGELVMKGYWRDEEATALAIQDGWLHTGDVGRLDEDGYIQITDRKKDIIVFSGGDNVSPARIEGFLTLQEEIHQAMVFGDKRPHLVALLVPDEEFLNNWARDNEKNAGLQALSADPDLHKRLAEVIDRVNRLLSPMEKIRRFVIAPETFTTDNAMMTPTLKIRRHKIIAEYGKALDELYEKKKT